MNDLRYVLRPEKYQVVRQDDGTWLKVPEKVLQQRFRARIQDGDGFRDEWTEWQDVPTVTEE